MVACRARQGARRERGAENQRNWARSGVAFTARKAAQRSRGEEGVGATLQKGRGENGTNPGDRGPSPYDAENDLRASRTVRYWRWLMGTASLQSMTSPSAEAWTTCSIFAK